jgi:stearoyl-CoA desaturase (delta-9 desaturase)
MARAPDERVDLRVCLPLLALHGLCALTLVSGTSALALGVCLALVFGRAFGLSAGYHRLLSHHSFACGRGTRFALAWLGASGAQLGPLWWAGHHRLHHRHADGALDPHSPHARGLWWAHIGWLVCRKHVRAPLEAVPDLARAPELRFLERFHWLPPATLAAGLFAAGAALERHAPALGTSGLQLFAWGFCVSTVLLYHLTFAVNSLGHRYGAQRWAGRDQSRNLPWLAWLTLGDGWHNNHHAAPGRARHGIAAGELDLTWLGLRLLERLGLAWDLREAALPLPGHPEREHDARHA